MIPGVFGASLGICLSRWLRLAVLLLGLFGSLAPVQSSAAPDPLDRLTLVTEHYPPFNFEQDGALQGIAVDLLVAMLDRAGSALGRRQIRLLPWARGYDLVQKRPGTILFATTRSASRERLFAWVGPIAPTVVGLTALKSAGVTVSGPEDLKRLSLGAIRDDIGEQMLTAAGVPARQIHTAARNIVNIRLLNAGRIDAWAYEVNVAAWDLKSNGFNPSAYEQVYTLTEGKLFYALHPATDASVVQRLQQALESLVTDGTHDAITARYLQ